MAWSCREGEWQKVALARGFVRDAAVVILDEPTAALDAEAEYRLFEQFRELGAGQDGADHQPPLFDGPDGGPHRGAGRGRIIEAGSHAALVAQGGRYATLYEMQAGRYR